MMNTILMERWGSKGYGWSNEYTSSSVVFHRNRTDINYQIPHAGGSSILRIQISNAEQIEMFKQSRFSLDDLGEVQKIIGEKIKHKASYDRRQAERNRARKAV